MHIGEPDLLAGGILHSGRPPTMHTRQPHLRVVRSPEDPSGPVDFDTLFGRYASYVAGVAARLLGRDDHEVEDVVQDVFWIASRRLHRIHSLEAARPWLVTVAVRVVRKRLRRRAWRQLLHLQPEAVEVPATGATAEEYALLQRMYRVLDTIRAEDRLAWLLRHVEQERLEDVALACGCSLATAKRRIAAAQEVLQGVLRDE
jgi:RNA polymerase sigma-70 factor (ECF subfamily)